MTTLVSEFKKIGSDDKTKYDTFYLNSKTKTIINESWVDDIFESVFKFIISLYQTYLDLINININL